MNETGAPPARLSRLRPVPVNALPDTVGISRALAGLRRVHRGRPKTDIDESATAQFMAEHGFLLPVLQAARRHHLDLALVVDRSPSMAVWSHTADAFTGIAARLGTFRTVRTFSLLLPRDEDSRIRLRGGSDPGMTQPHPDRLVLVLTDTVHGAWARGSTLDLLRRWGAHQSVAVVNPLPQRLWSHSSAGLADAAFDAPPRAVTNEQWRTGAIGPLGGVRAGAVPIPMFALDRYWLGNLVRLMNGGSRNVRAAMLIDSAPSAGPAPAAPADAETRVRRFRGVAGPDAYRLATHLAAVPLSLSTMRLVQNAVLPSSTPAALAEVLLSGLIERTEQLIAHPHPDDDLYDFRAGVRQILVSNLSRADALDMVSLVSGRFAESQTSASAFRAMLSDPAHTPLDTPESRRLTATTAEVLATFGPRYESAAHLLSTGHSVNLASAPPISDDDRSRRDQLRTRVAEQRFRRLRELDAGSPAATDERLALAKLLRADDIGHLGIRMDLTGAHLVDADFSGCTFTDLDATGATFTGRTSFSGATFTGTTSFADCRFDGPVWFHGSYIGGELRFTGSRFSSTPGLGGVRIDGSVLLADVFIGAESD